MTSSLSLRLALLFSAASPSSSPSELVGARTVPREPFPVSRTRPSAPSFLPPSSRPAVLSLPPFSPGCPRSPPT
eukprot:537501-Pleurochrysis_carterae.AAC.1